MQTRILLSAILAGSVIAVPVSAEAAQKRKTLFEVLFKKTNERKSKKKQKIQVLRKQQSQRQQATAPKKKAKKKLPKVETSKNYTYSVAKRAPIVLVAAPVSFALANTGSEGVQSEQVTLSPMTTDIVNAGKMDLHAEIHLASAVADFYKNNQNYYWLDEVGAYNARAKSALKVLSQADAYGLRPDDYQVDAGILAYDLNDKALSREKINREIALTTAVLRYAMDAKFGTINPNLLSGYHDFPVHYGQSADVLQEVMESSILQHTLQSLHPSNAKFNALKRELASLREIEDDIIELDPKTFIRPGQSHAEIPNIVMAIKKRGSKTLLEAHSEVLDEYYGYLEYSKELVPVIKAYQKEAGLGPDGIIGRNTITKLAGIPSHEKAMKLALSMERLRWHPHQFGERHVFINQPEYRARYIENGKEALSMRVVVGKKSNQTNFFYDEIEHVTFNPYWGVPRSIIVNEFAPKSVSNPGYLDQRGYELRTWGGKKISSSNINWSEIGTNPQFSVRQKPGPKNALGSLKIMFPNKHAIYMHDTPAKSLFKRQHRAYSHGCIRLHDPQAMAAAVLGKSKSHVNARIKPGKNKTEKLAEKVPVYVSYFTAWPQEDGTVKYFNDMYDRDAHLIKAFKATEKARSISIGS